LKLGGSTQIASQKVKISSGYKQNNLKPLIEKSEKILRDYDKVKIPANND
jgi:hypothetical protein